MTGAELRTFVETGLDAGSINDTSFYQLLNAAKTIIEEERDWKFLEKERTAALVAGDYTTMNGIASDFGAFIRVFLADSANHEYPLYEIPFAMRARYKDIAGRYYLDLANSGVGITGAVPAGYATLHQIYRAASAEITSATSWVAPARFHAVLGFMVAEMYKGGVDYDEVSARQVLQNSKDGKALYEAMLAWDIKLREKEQEGQYESGGAYNSDGIPSGGAPEFPLGLM